MYAKALSATALDAKQPAARVDGGALDGEHQDDADEDVADRVGEPEEPDEWGISSEVVERSEAEGPGHRDQSKARDPGVDPQPYACGACARAGEDKHEDAGRGQRYGAQEPDIGGRGEWDRDAEAHLVDAPDDLARPPARRRDGQQQPPDPLAPEGAPGGHAAACCGHQGGHGLADVVHRDRDRVSADDEPGPRHKAGHRHDGEGQRQQKDGRLPGEGRPAELARRHRIAGGPRRGCTSYQEGLRREAARVLVTALSLAPTRAGSAR